MNSPDFTEAAYDELLSIASERYEFKGSDISGKLPVVCWRHDVDYSPHRALAMARLEAKRGVRCVYHILCSSRYYNILEPEISNIICEISHLGHELGLHFDMDVFNGREVSKDDVFQRITIEKTLLEAVSNETLVSFSFHNHVLHLSEIVEEASVCGMINLASPSFYKPTKYLSDSNGFWRYESLRTLLEGDIYDKLHILTHPVWWTPEDILPMQRVFRTVEGRARSNRNIYIQTMERDGRLRKIGEKIGVTDEDMRNAGVAPFDDE